LTLLAWWQEEHLACRNPCYLSPKVSLLEQANKNIRKNGLTKVHFIIWKAAIKIEMILLIYNYMYVHVKPTLEHSYGNVNSGCQQMNIFSSSEDAISGFL